MFGCAVSQRVLIVDDECVIADSLARIFRNEGYSARAVYSAEQALQIASDWPPRLAIIDLRLPGINGVELAILFQTEHPDCRLLLFTGQNESELTEIVRGSGHRFVVLQKPVGPANFISLASGLLNPVAFGVKSPEAHIANE